MNLRDSLAALGRRWVLVAAVLLLAVAAALGATLLIPDSYQGQTQLFVTTIDTETSNQQLYQGGSFAVDRVKSYTRLVDSPKVLDPVAQQLGLGPSGEQLAGRITATAPTDTVLIDITAEDRSPRQAAALANAVAGELGRLIESLEAPPSGLPSPVKATVLQQAAVPTQPVWPNLPLNLALGIVLGLVLGVGGALVLDRLDVTIRNTTDLGRASSLPVLATVARDPDGASSPLLRIGTDRVQDESYRQLRTNLQFAAVDDKPRIILVTSAVAVEGKTSAAGMLALSLQRLGTTVCLVDADLRRPSVSKYFQLVPEAGLTTVLIGRAKLDSVLQTVAPGFDALTCGPIPPNPGELLASGQMSTVLEELSRRYETVIVDAPPVLPVADASVLATKADGVLFVVRCGSTTRPQVEQALNTLGKVKARMLGLVLNMAPAKTSGGYYRYDSYSETTGKAGTEEAVAGPGNPVETTVAVRSTSAPITSGPVPPAAGSQHVPNGDGSEPGVRTTMAGRPDGRRPPSPRPMNPRSDHR